MATQVPADDDRSFAGIRFDLKVLKWLQAATFAGVIAALLKLFVH